VVTAGWKFSAVDVKIRASIPLDAIRRPRHKPIWKLEAALECRSCRTPRCSPPKHIAEEFFNAVPRRTIKPVKQPGLS
jgi:hypothetical protein